MRHAPVRIAVAAVLTAGVVGGGAIALAQEEPPVSGEVTPAAATAGSTTEGTQARAESFVADVAAELGVSPEELDAAVRAVLTDRIESAEAHGRLDAETADHLIAAVSDGTLREVVRERLAERDPRRPWYRQGRPLPRAGG